LYSKAKFNKIREIQPTSLSALDRYKQRRSSLASNTRPSLFAALGLQGPNPEKEQGSDKMEEVAIAPGPSQEREITPEFSWPELPSPEQIAKNVALLEAAEAAGAVPDPLALPDDLPPYVGESSEEPSSLAIAKNVAQFQAMEAADAPAPTASAEQDPLDSLDFPPDDGEGSEEPSPQTHEASDGDESRSRRSSEGDSDMIEQDEKEDNSGSPQFLTAREIIAQLEEQQRASQASSSPSLKLTTGVSVGALTQQFELFKEDTAPKGIFNAPTKLHFSPSTAKKKLGSSEKS
ncbi:MAG: hypothetical protein ACHQJ6_04500, partial [Candidatus Berkiellales bacterium]